MTLRGLIQRPRQVAAFLAGRRTQVRVPLRARSEADAAVLANAYDWTPGFDGRWFGLTAGDHGYEETNIRCPLGEPGTLLAIRETWARVPATAYRASTGVQQTVDPADPEMAAIYRAGWELSPPGVGWRSPAVMPLRLARLRYRVLDVRAHLVWEISEGNAEAEGARNDHSMKWPDGDPGTMGDVYRRNFAGQWNEMYGPGSWERDWCFAATVERIDGEVA